jgi:hypothetical protein
MEVEYRVNTFLAAELDDTIKMLEPLLLENARVHVILKVAIIEREADAIETQ